MHALVSRKQIRLQQTSERVSADWRVRDTSAVIPTCLSISTRVSLTTFARGYTAIGRAGYTLGFAKHVWLQTEVDTRLFLVI